MKRILIIFLFFISLGTYAQMGITDMDTMHSKAVQIDSVFWIKYLPTITTTNILGRDATTGKIGYILSSEFTQTANEVDITDAGGYFTGSEVETALQELGANIASGGDGWGSDVVNTDITLTGDGTSGNVLKVDTTKLATQYDLTQISEGTDNQTLSIDSTINRVFTLSIEYGNSVEFKDNNTTYTSGDFDHNSLLNTHNLTTDIDHDQLTNFTTTEHFTQGAISITESQISDLDHFTNADETDQVYTAWDKDYDDLTNKPTIPSGNQIIDWTLSTQGTIHATNYVDNNTQLSDGDIATFGYIKTYTETDPIYIASQASNITAGDITNLGNLSGTNSGNQTLTIAGTTSPTITLSGSNTATFAASTGITLGQSGGTITITNNSPNVAQVYPSAGIALSTGSAWGTSITNNSANRNIAYNDKINSLAFTGTTTKTLTLTQQDGGTVSNTFTDLNTTYTSGDFDHNSLTGLNSGTDYEHITETQETNFETAYTNRITSLTTTGSSGAATLSSNTLNIPNYTLSGLGYTTPDLDDVLTAGNTSTLDADFGGVSITDITDSELTLVSTYNGTWVADDIKGIINFYSSDASGGGAGNHAWIKAVAHDTYGANTDLVLGTAISGGEATEALRIDYIGRIITSNKVTAGADATSGYDLVPYVQLTDGSFNPIFGDITADNIDLTDLTTGYIPYQTASGFDDSPIYTDGTDVGIGNTSPNSELDVNGDIEADAIKLTVGATDGYFLKSDASGNGTWAAVSASQVYKGTISGSTGVPTAGGSALIDETGTTGWYYRCTTAGTYDYGNPSGNSITLAVGDDIYYNGTSWEKIPSATAVTSVNTYTGAVALYPQLSGNDLNIVGNTTTIDIGNATDVAANTIKVTYPGSATATELNILDGATVTTTELNILDGATVTTTELNILDGVTSTTTEINKLDGFTGDYLDLNYAEDLKATGVTSTEFDYLDGVTSNIQTQFDNFYSYELVDMPDGAGNLKIPIGNGTQWKSYALSGDATMTALGVVTVVDDSHNHIISNIDGLQTELDLKLESSDLSGYAQTGVNNIFTQDQRLTTASPTITLTDNTPSTTTSGITYVDHASTTQAALGFNDSDETIYLWGYNTAEDYEIKFGVANVEMMRIKSDGFEFRDVGASPANAQSGYGKYTVINDKPYFRDDSGNQYDLSDTGTGGGAPVDAYYITKTADGTLTNETALSGLSTGFMHSTIGTGAVTTQAKLVLTSALDVSGTLPSANIVSALTSKTYNGVTLTTGGSASNFLNAQGNYVSAGGSTSPAGSDGEIQYNDLGSFGSFGDWDGTRLTVGGQIDFTTMYMSDDLILSKDLYSPYWQRPVQQWAGNDAPTNPLDGAFWYELDDDEMHVRVDGAWETVQTDKNQGEEVEIATGSFSSTSQTISFSHGGTGDDMQICKVKLVVYADDDTGSGYSERAIVFSSTGAAGTSADLEATHGSVSNLTITFDGTNKEIDCIIATSDGTKTYEYKIIKQWMHLY